MMQIHTPVSQRGASLFTALIILVALTLVSLGSLGTSLLELRMSGNEEASMGAFQAAQAAIDATVASAETNIVVAGTVGNRSCYNISGCEQTLASMPSPIGSNHTIQITRITDEGCPPRTRDSATTCAKQHAATFTIDGMFDKTLYGQGKSDLVQGYIKLIPVTQEQTSGAPKTAAHN